MGSIFLPAFFALAIVALFLLIAIAFGIKLLPKKYQKITFVTIFTLCLFCSMGFISPALMNMIVLVAIGYSMFLLAENIYK